MATTKTYDPSAETVVACGIPIDKEAYADGTFIEVTRLTDTWVDVSGTGGGVARAKQLDRRGTITVTLLQTAPVNAALSAMAVLDENTEGGAGVLPSLVKDRVGLSLYEGLESWVVKMPDVTLEKGVTARQWQIRCAVLEMFEGGN